MTRISFRQGMLAGFAAIVLMLGGAALHAWLLLEDLMVESRQNSAQALQLSSAIQELAERTVDVERSARQYLVLEDSLFRQRFDDHLGEALVLVARLDALPERPLAALPAGWQVIAGALRTALDRKVEQAELAPLLARLVELNERIRDAGQRWIEAKNARLLGELEQRRLQLGGQLGFALFGALLAVLGMGWWLVRPVRQLEAAIDRLGAGRFAEEIAVGGPDDLRRVGRRLDWLRLHLAELEADRERSLRHVSHELKTPLTALKEGVALLAEEVPGPLLPEQGEVVDILGHNVSELQVQIESLLNLNAAAFDARHLMLAPVVVTELIAAAVQRHALHSQARGLTVEVEAASGKALLDAVKMGVILDNLLANAIDFSPEGGTVCLRALHARQHWRFECQDEGPGVASEDALRIFEPFVQGRQAAPVPRSGSGVGLSIVRELAAAMGGTVRLLPSARGAHFCVELPDER